MVKIRDNNIILTRGDSLNLIITVKDKNGQEIIYPNDYQFIFTMKKYCESTMPTMRKETENSKYIEISPAETSDLPIGDYFYDVQLLMNDNRYTVIPPHKFKICKEVGYNDESSGNNDYDL